MTYNETIEYLYNAAPAFEKVGASAYKEGLSNTKALDEHAGHPHQHYLSVHVAGTNGKGSCSHTLAAILQASGLRVGLYTSPHLVTFRERIRVNGVMISEQWVVDWVERNRDFFEPLSPSFFELATAMAFEYFKDQKVDIAIVEVGLGGRLDCTNIISPILSVITNISFDHTQFLGNTLAEIAGEKAGIIKHKTPVVIGETTPETRPVFEEIAKEKNAPIIFAEDNNISLDGDFELKGLYQEKNRRTILNCMLPLARELWKRGIHINNATANIKYGMANVCKLTGLNGRWQQLNDKPLIICDTGHNVAGWTYLQQQIKNTAKDRNLRVVFGMVDDKDINTVMTMLADIAAHQPTSFYFTQASTHRAIPVERIYGIAKTHGLRGNIYNNVLDAYKSALIDANENDFIFIGGSSYIVADLLSNF